MRRLKEDESTNDWRWYAYVEKCHGGKHVRFEMFDPSDWERYTADYYESEDKINFDYVSIQSEKNTLTLIRKMISFIDSDLYKSIDLNVENFDEDDFIFEI